jgi:hypothetical protein
VRFFYSRSIRHRIHAALTSTVRAAEHGAVSFDAMADNTASAMAALRRELMDCAFEAVKDVTVAVGVNLEALVVIVPADVTPSH